MRWQKGRKAFVRILLLSLLIFLYNDCTSGLDVSKVSNSSGSIASSSPLSNGTSSSSGGSTSSSGGSSSGSSTSSSGSSSGSSSSSSSGIPNGVFGIKVSGNKLVSTLDGSTVQLLGVSISGLEQGATSLNTGSGYYPTATDPGFAQMASWNMNLVRIPLNEATWLGKAGCADDGGSATTLQNNLKAIVNNANSKGIYVILDLHWSAPNNFVSATATGCPVGQGAMPDADNTINFWTSVANTFKGNPAVMFEMFNEPFANYNYNNSVAAINSTPPAGQSATDLSILLNGGTYNGGYWYQCNNGGIACPSGQSQGNQYLAPNTGPFKVAGMQQILNAIRSTGSTNVVISNSIWWAGEIETWLSSKPTDPAGQLASGWHEDGGGSATTSAAGAVLSAGYPIIITEGYNNGAQTVSQTSDAAGTNYFNWAMTNKVGFSYWVWANYGGLLQNGTGASPTAMGATLKAAYCAQAKVNSLASCP